MDPWLLVYAFLHEYPRGSFARRGGHPGDRVLERCARCSPTKTARADQDCALVVATLAFLVWEVCITLADEVDFVWSYVCLSHDRDIVLIGRLRSTRFFWAKAAHLTLRYYTLVVVLCVVISFLTRRV
jgi:hypothetical protein